MLSRPYLPELINYNHPLARGLQAWWLAAPGLTGGPVWWELVRNQSAALINMSNSNNGWFPTTRPGGFGRLKFDGTAGYATGPEDPLFLANATVFSIAFWSDIQASELGGTYRHAYINEDDQRQVGGIGISFDGRMNPNGLSGTSLFVCSVGVVGNAGHLSSSLSGDVPNDGKWHHYIATYNGTTSTLYIDGLPITVQTSSIYNTTGNFVPYNGPFYFGHDPQGGGYLPASLDDIRLYTRVISSQEAADLYNNSRLGYPSLLRQTRTLPSPGVTPAVTTTLVPRGSTNLYLPKPVNDKHPLARGLVSWWLATPGLTGGPVWWDLIDDFNGQLSGFASPGSGWSKTTRPGGFGHLAFNGTSNVVVTAGTILPSGASPRTLSLWFNFNGTYNDYNVLAAITGTSYAYGFYIDKTSHHLIAWGGGDGTDDTGYTPVANAWTHLSSTYDGTTLNVYVNGSLVFSTSKTYHTQNTYFEVGGNYISGVDYFNGFIDDVRVYSRAFSAGEASDLYRNSKTGYAALLNTTKPLPLLSLNQTTSSPPTKTPKRTGVLPYLPKMVNNNHPLAQGLVGWWLPIPGLTGGTKWWDIVGNNNGTLTNMGAGFGWATNTRPGSFGAMSCNGTSSYVTVPSTPALQTGNKSFTTMCWFKTTNTGVSLIGKAHWSGDGEWQIWINLFGNVGFATSSSVGNLQQVLTSTAFNDGKWHFCVGMQNTVTGQIGISIDGGPFATNTITHQSVSTSDPLNIGASSDNAPSNYLLGSIDDVRFYNYAMTQSQASEIYENSILGCPGLLNRPRSVPMSLGISPTTPVGKWLRKPTASPYLPKLINDNHPLVQGLSSWYLCVPGLMGGAVWWDIAGKINGSLRLFSAQTWTGTARPGGFGQLDFNGSNSTVNLGNVFNFGTGAPFSVAIWMCPAVNMNSSTSRMAIVYKDSAWAIEYSIFIGGFLGFSLSNGTAHAGSFINISAGVWTHLVGVYDGATAYLYVNGKIFAVASIGSVSNSSSHQANIGSENGNISFNGGIDDVRIFNIPLSASQVFELYRNSLLGYPNVLNQRISPALGLSGVLNRKTLSGLGTRIGKRQPQPTIQGL